MALGWFKMAVFEKRIIKETMSGCLYIVPTPIGNLKDITLRALDVLAAVDWIAAEDTRHSKTLLQHFAINRPLISLHDHNEQARAADLLVKLQAGEQGALISDAGTPLISDPGYHLVKLLRDSGVSVVPLPGPNAMITALSAAGLPTDRFGFEGFLPAKPLKRIQRLQAVASATETLVFYESPHRLLASLAAMESVLGGQRKMAVAKELTKQFERFVTGTITEVIAQFTQSDENWVRGEFVVMVAGASPQSEDAPTDYDALIQVLLKQSIHVKQISEIVADYLGVQKKVAYQRILYLRERV